MYDWNHFNTNINIFNVHCVFNMIIVARRVEQTTLHTHISAESCSRKLIIACCWLFVSEEVGCETLEQVGMFDTPLSGRYLTS